jgi:hypothetical protein
MSSRECGRVTRGAQYATRGILIVEVAGWIRGGEWGQENH